MQVLFHVLFKSLWADSRLLFILNEYASNDDIPNANTEDTNAPLTGTVSCSILQLMDSSGRCKYIRDISSLQTPTVTQPVLRGTIPVVEDEDVRFGDMDRQARKTICLGTPEECTTPLPEVYIVEKVHPREAFRQIRHSLLERRINMLFVINYLSADMKRRTDRKIVILEEYSGFCMPLFNITGFIGVVRARTSHVSGEQKYVRA